MNVVTQRGTSFHHQDNATDAVASVTAAAPGGRRQHYVTHISASFDDASAGGVLTLALANGDDLVVDVHGGLELDFASPIRGGEAQAVTLSLTSGGAGVTGRVNLVGYTL